MAGIKELRYIKRTALVHEQRIQKEYFREIIHSYGIDVSYYRKYIDFYKNPFGDVNYTYGEDSTASYYLSGDMVVYMEMMGDSFLLSKFGIETDGDCAIFLTIDDFNEQFRNSIGVTISSTYSENISANISGGTGVITANISGDDLYGTVTDNVLSGASGLFYQDFNQPINILPKAVNSDVKGPSFYNYGQYQSSGNMVGTLSGYRDLSGNGSISGRITGEILHTTKPAELRGPGWDDISPQVGDFFRIDFDETNKEEYIITRVHDRNLQTDGLNPLLGKYIWKCDCVRRDPSHEDVIGDVQEEFGTTSKLEQNDWHEDVSDEIFDYVEPVDNIDKENSDSVYGGW